MTSRNNPENQKPNGPHDLGQIIIKPLRLEPQHIDDGAGRTVRIAVTYYGTMFETPPSNNAQISISQGGFDACVHLTPAQLRTLSARLCEAAIAIEDGQNEAASFKYQGA